MCLHQRGKGLWYGPYVSYVRYPGLLRVWREKEDCALGQSVFETDSSASCSHAQNCFFFLGETLQPGFRGMVWHAPKLFCLHHNLGVPPLTERLDSCEPLRFCDLCGLHRPSDQTKCLVLDLVKGLFSRTGASALLLTISIVPISVVLLLTFSL